MMAGEKRSKDQDESLLKENIIVLDIEGTTTSITFVKEKLFPYVRENVKNYLDAKWEDEEFKRDLEKLKEQAKKDEEDKAEGLVPISGSNADEEKESVVKNVLWQMDGDRKTGALKQLQGHMWREAYESGKIKGHVYEDVRECLKSWKNAGKKIYVYSSGSVEAQKLLFGHSEHGDLLEYFSGYFDTEIGMKQEASSYKNILNHIKAEGSDVIFLTDIAKEAKAAKEAGLSTVIMIREGNAALSEEDRAEYKTAKSFLDLSFVNAAKRPKLETAEDAKDEVKSEPTAVVEKMEVVEDDVEMKDVSEDKESKAKEADVRSVNESKTESETNDVKTGKDDGEKNKEIRVEAAPAADKDEAMETDGKPESVSNNKIVDDSMKKICENSTDDDNKETTGKTDPIKSEKISPSSKVDDEGKSNNEESSKAEDKEKEKAELSDEKKMVVVDETDKAVIVEESKKMETTDKKEEKEKTPTTEEAEKVVPAKVQTNDSADIAMDEESVATVAQTSDTKSTNVTTEKNATENKTEGSKSSSELKIKEKILNTETEKAVTEAELKLPTSDAKEICTKSESAAAPKADEMMETSKEKEKTTISDSEKKLSTVNEAPSKSEEAVIKSKNEVEESVKENGTSEASVSAASKVEAVASSKTDKEVAVAVTDNKANESETETSKTEKKMEESVAVKDSKESEVAPALVKSKEEKAGNASDSSVVLSESNKEIESKDSSVDKSGEDKQSEKDNLTTETTTKTEVTSESSKESTTNVAAAAAAAVEQTIKKINGTTAATQNGKDSSSSPGPANNDNQQQQQQKIHTNGVNEARSSGDATADAKTNKESPASASSSSTSSSTSTSSPQKREQPESSTDPSAGESIKVKKVVDSTSVADGAGEPDVVPPTVVVAATS